MWRFQPLLILPPFLSSAFSQFQTFDRAEEGMKREDGGEFNFYIVHTAVTEPIQSCCSLCSPVEIQSFLVFSQLNCSWDRNTIFTVVIVLFLGPLEAADKMLGLIR